MEKEKLNALKQQWQSLSQQCQQFQSQCKELSEEELKEVAGAGKPLLPAFTKVFFDSIFITSEAN